MAIRGDDVLRIQWRAGHTTFAMTQKYIEAARKVATGFGVPFPPLPACLLDGSGEVELSRNVSRLRNRTQNTSLPSAISAEAHGNRTRSGRFRALHRF